MTSTISVIIPVFKRVDLLTACLESFKMSSVQPLEIIVADDGNMIDDACAIEAICEKFQTRIVHCGNNTGASAARNRGAHESIGEFIFFADADVVIAPHALEQLLYALKNYPEAAFAYGDFIYGTIKMKSKVFSRDVLMRENFISTMSLVRRATFLGFDESLRRFQDWDLWLSITARGGVGVYVPQTIFKAHASGSMSTWIPAIIVHYYKFFLWIPRVRVFVRARKIIAQKHGLKL